MEILEFVWKNSIEYCKAKEIHLVYDCYLQYSIKDVERSHRKSGLGVSGVELNEISGDVPIPKQIETFWAESSNKIRLQDFSRQYYNQKFECSLDIILSGVLYGEDILNADNIPAVKILAGGQEVAIGLTAVVEEADMRIIPHVMESIKRGNRRIVVLANDTDVLILLLRYMDKFIDEGALELWIRIGNQGKQRFIPIHTLYEKLGMTFCRVLLKAYIVWLVDTYWVKSCCSEGELC